MSLSELTKEQKQYIVLGIFVGAALIVLMVFVVKISFSSITTAKVELDDVASKIARAESTLKDREQVTIDFAATKRMLSEHIAATPPMKNYYSWATEIIYSRAREANLEVDAVDELESASRPPIKDDEVVLEVYTLRISAQGSYEAISRFLGRLEQDQELMRISGVDIRTGKTPESHIAQVFAQWPFNLGVLEGGWEKVDSQKTIIRRGDQSTVIVPADTGMLQADAQPVGETFRTKNG